MRVLGLVPARGGSKGIPRKNIRPLGGKPLLQYTAEAALASRRLARVILSTEDAEVAEVGRRCGLEVPFMRPNDLAQDETPTLPVVLHAIRTLEAAGEAYEAVCLLQPTHPLRTAELIDDCIGLFESSRADCVITVLPVPDEHNPHWVYFQRSDGSLYPSLGESQPIPRRQALPPAFHREGSVYVTRRAVLLNQNSLYGQRVLPRVLRRADSLNLDTLDDWERAEMVMRGKYQ